MTVRTVRRDATQHAPCGCVLRGAATARARGHCVGV